jgi:outer membrane protein assembly factor BamD (BamD/ComL family)
MASSSSSPTGAAPASATADSSIIAELHTLDQARAALSNGSPAQALALLDAYALRFPHASMKPEATVLRIEALERAGDLSAATRVAQAFLRSNPSSPYASRIRSLLGESNRESNP